MQPNVGQGQGHSREGLRGLYLTLLGVMLGGDSGSVVDSRSYHPNSKNLPYDGEWDLPTMLKRFLPMILGG